MISTQEESKPVLLVLGSERALPEFLVDWVQQECERSQQNFRIGMLDAFIPIPDGHMVIVLAPHDNPAMRDHIQDISTHVPTLIIGHPEDRAFYPEASVWLDLTHMTPHVLRHGMAELQACIAGHLRPLLPRQTWMLQFRNRIKTDKQIYLQLVSCRWRPAAAGDSAELRFATQQSFEHQLRANAPEDAMIGKLLDDQFVIISHNEKALSAHWLHSFADNMSFLWTAFLSSPVKLDGYDDLGEALQHCVREIEHSRMMQSGLGGRSLNHNDSGVVQDLVRALRGKEFYLDFQPQFDTSTGIMVGAEALLRWLHPNLGIIPPTTFIRDAEMAGLIRTLGSWALRETLGTWHKLNDKGISLRMAVNVSFPEVADPDYADKVLALLEEFQVPASCLELELTETAMMLDASVSLRNLRLLKQAGIHIVLDDFGTGFSSLSHLSDLPITGIKLDRAFVTPLSQLEDNSKQMHIVATMLDLAQRLELETTAEGIEDQNCLEVIHALGCDRIQGYFYAQPMSVDKLIERACVSEAVLCDYSGQQSLF